MQSRLSFIFLIEPSYNLKVDLSREMVFLGRSMYFQLEPITTLASGRFTLMKPEIFDCGVFSVTMTSNNAESVHGVYNIGFFFCSFAPSPHFHVEGIIHSFFLLQQFPFFYASCVLNRIIHFISLPEASTRCESTG